MTLGTAHRDLPPLPPVDDAPGPGARADPAAAGARSWPTWTPDAVLVAVTVAGLALFVVSLRGIDLARMNGLGLLSVLPLGAIVGVIIIALAFVVGLVPAQGLPDRRSGPPSSSGLVVCLDGITAFAEPEPRFPTTYQIAGFVDYISRPVIRRPDLAAYFSWPGFFALIAFVTGTPGSTAC